MSRRTSQICLCWSRCWVSTSNCSNSRRYGLGFFGSWGFPCILWGEGAQPGHAKSTDCWPDQRIHLAPHHTRLHPVRVDGGRRGGARPLMWVSLEEVSMETPTRCCSPQQDFSSLWDTTQTHVKGRNTHQIMNYKQQLCYHGNGSDRKCIFSGRDEYY